MTFTTSYVAARLSFQLRYNLKEVQRIFRSVACRPQIARGLALSYMHKYILYACKNRAKSDGYAHINKNNGDISQLRQ